MSGGGFGGGGGDWHAGRHAQMHTASVAVTRRRNTHTDTLRKTHTHIANSDSDEEGVGETAERADSVADERVGGLGSLRHQRGPFDDLSHGHFVDRLI